MIDPKTLRKGQPVALVLTVDDIIPNTKPGGAYIQLGGQEIHDKDFKVSIGYGDDEMGEIYASPDFIIPAPREGEYRLTLDELAEIMEEADKYRRMYTEAGYGMPSYRHAVGKILENRKETK